jgi:hypothetical protein
MTKKLLNKILQELGRDNEKICPRCRTHPLSFVECDKHYEWECLNCNISWSRGHSELNDG